MGAMALSKSSYARVLGANDRVQLGLLGCGGRGRGVTGGLPEWYKTRLLHQQFNPQGEQSLELTEEDHV